MRKTGRLLCLLVMLFLTGNWRTMAAQTKAAEHEVALLPVQVKGLRAEEGAELTERFGSALGESGRFRVVTGDPLARRLAAAGLTDTDTIITVPSLARLGELVGAGKVVRVAVERWGQRFLVDVQMVESSSGHLLYGERVDFTGSFEELLTRITPEQGRKLSQAFLDRQPNWVLIAAGLIVGLGLIIWIFVSLGKQPNARSVAQGRS